MELIYSKNYFNLAEIFILRIFKMAANQTESSRLEQRSVIKFLVAEKCKPCEIYRRMSDVYGEACFSEKNVYKWAELYEEGRKSVRDDDSSIQPPMSSTPEMVDSVNALILADRRVSIKDISEQLGISLGTANKIVHDELAFSKVSCRWVPKTLTPEHKQMRVQLSQVCLSRFQNDGEDFLKKIITCAQRSVKKVMLTVFWDMNGPITIHFLEKGATVNSASYCQLLRQVEQDVKNKRKDRQSFGVIFHQDNASPHTAARTVETINQFGWEQLPHPPCSPDLSPSDFHLFGPLKKFLRGTKFSSDDEVKSTVSKWLETQPKDFYAEGIQKLVSRWEKCVLKNGDYIKK